MLRFALRWLRKGNAKWYIKRVPTATNKKKKVTKESYFIFIWQPLCRTTAACCRTYRIYRKNGQRVTGWSVFLCLRRVPCWGKVVSSVSDVTASGCARTAILLLLAAQANSSRRMQQQQAEEKFASSRKHTELQSCQKWAFCAFKLPHFKHKCSLSCLESVTTFSACIGPVFPDCNLRTLSISIYRTAAWAVS